MMPFAPVVLWTDALIFVLLAVVVAAGYYVRRQPHLLVAWQRVGESRAGMAALTLLALFVVVGIVDSLHYRPRLTNGDGQKAVAFGVEVLSAFDALANGLRTRNEKTYSAPLATHGFVKDTLELPDGSQYRGFPRLRFGGADLKDTHRDWASDVFVGGLRGLAVALASWLAVAAVLVGLLALRHRQRPRRVWRAIVSGETNVAWNAVL